MTSSRSCWRRRLANLLIFSDQQPRLSRILASMCSARSTLMIRRESLEVRFHAIHNCTPLTCKAGEVVCACTGIRGRGFSCVRSGIF